MAALLLDIQPGDEVIMPSYTFVSTANAFVLRGGVPVFVDIREDTLNLDERLIESAITPRKRYGRPHGDLKVTVRQAERLIRLPLWVGLSPLQQSRVVEVLSNALL